MNAARELEARVIARCAEVARGLSSLANDEIEANVFAAASGILGVRFPALGARLKVAADGYFEANPNAKLALGEVIDRGWIVSLPRLKDRLYRSLDLTGRLTAPF